MAASRVSSWLSSPSTMALAAPSLRSGTAAPLPSSGVLLQCGGSTSSSSSATTSLPCLRQQQRSVIKHPARIVMGHKMEIMKNREKRGKISSIPKYPAHPSEPDRNMNLLTQYADMKLRWSFKTRWSNKRWKIARKWHPIRNDLPYAPPTSSFIWHNEMPITSRNVDAHGAHAVPPIPKIDTQDLFAIFKSNIYLQHKVTVGDLVQVEKLKLRNAGEKVVFGTVLMVGGRSFTILGKPTVPYARVRCTVEQQTLAGEKMVFRCGNSNQRYTKFWRRRQYVTMLRVDEIEVDAERIHYEKEKVPKPDRILDLWANRWLTAEERALIPRGKDGTVDAAKWYDGSEHQPGSYHWRGLCEAYRFYPDPGHSHWMY